MIDINRAAMRAGAHKVVALFGSGTAHPAAVLGLQYVAALDEMGGDSFYAGDDPVSELLGAVGVLQFMRERYTGPGQLGNAASVVVPLAMAMNKGLLPAGVLNATPDPVPEPPVDLPMVVSPFTSTGPKGEWTAEGTEPEPAIEPTIEVHSSADEVSTVEEAAKGVSEATEDDD